MKKVVKNRKNEKIAIFFLIPTNKFVITENNWILPQNFNNIFFKGIKLTENFIVKKEIEFLQRISLKLY